MLSGGPAGSFDALAKRFGFPLPTAMFWEFVRFGMVGVLATIVGISLLVFFVERLSIHPVLGIALAFSVAVIVSYVGNLVWTFRVRGRHVERFPRFIAVQLAGLFGNMAVMAVVYDLLGLHYLVGVLVSLVVVPPVVFALNRAWTFR